MEHACAIVLGRSTVRRCQVIDVGDGIDRGGAKAEKG
jgi:hypothetical protein